MLVTDFGDLKDLSKQNERKVLTFHVVTNITVAIVFSGYSDVNDLMMVTVGGIIIMYVIVKCKESVINISNRLLHPSPTSICTQQKNENFVLTILANCFNGTVRLSVSDCNYFNSKMK